MFNFKAGEPSAKAWALRLLLGPAMIIDGLVSTLTFGFVTTGLSYKVAVPLNLERFLNTQRRHV